MDSPNIDSLDAWAFETRRVDKPWGYELIWALTDIYCGKVLFVKAGQSLSLQFHREKDESWLIQSGRAKIELGAVGEAALEGGGRRPGRRVPLRARAPSTGSPRSRTRRSSRSRRRTSTTSCASRTATAAKAPRPLARSARWVRRPGEDTVGLARTVTRGLRGYRSRRGAAAPAGGSAGAGRPGGYRVGQHSH